MADAQELRDNYVDVEEFCKQTGYSRPTVYRWITDGLIQSESVFFRRLIPKSEVERIQREGSPHRDRSR
jgi:excisionase family DNA binding protein